MSKHRLTLQPLSLRMTQKQAAGWLLFLYLCRPFFQIAFRTVLGVIGLDSLARLLTLSVIYGALLLYCIATRRFRAGDFLVLLLSMVVMFFVTYLFHPEYEEWYTRSFYGVWDYVFRPDNGLYIYLFLRLVDDPEEIMAAMKRAAWVMYIYFGARLASALARGYWIDEDSVGETVHLSYSLSFGYSVLLFALVLMYCALETHRAIDWIGAVIGLLMIFLGGSRGPVLDIAIFLLLYFLIKLEKSRRKGLIVVVTAAIGGLLYSTYGILLQVLSRLLSSLHISNRFVAMMISGDIADNNGRTRIWSAAWDMIRSKPLGYGAMGTRHVIGNIHIVGHPHQFFLEILVDFGVILGTALIIFLLYHCVRLLTMKNNDSWRGIFLIFLGRSCQLLVSGTFWHNTGFWGAVAVAVCIYSEKRRKEAVYGK